VPFWFTRLSGEELLAPLALFQLFWATTPATSDGAIFVLPAAKLIPIAADPEDAVPTTNVAVVEWLRLPLVPVIVRVELPGGVLVELATVRVELPAPFTGPKEAEALAGRPDALKLTVPVKPFSGVMLTV
jgi:hypothetical protein